MVDTAVNSQDVLVGIVGDPVVAFGDASSVSTSSGTPTAVYDVSETAGTATITLTRGGDLSQPLSVPFSTDDSGGHGGVNYTPVNTTVTFAVGSATATVAIPILDDPNASPPSIFRSASARRRAAPSWAASPWATCTSSPSRES